MMLEIEQVEIEGAPHAMLLRCCGVVDTMTLSDFERALEELRDEKIVHVLLDIERVRYVNSSGFSAIVKYSDAFRALGGGIALCSVPAKVQVVLEMLGLHTFFPIYSGERAGVEAMSAGNPFAEEEAEPEAAPTAAAFGSTTSSIAGGRTERIKPAADFALLAPRPEAGAVAVTYPITITCSACAASLDVPGSGAYRCPSCSVLFRAHPSGAFEFPETDASADVVHLAVDSGSAGRVALAAVIRVIGGERVAARENLDDAIGGALDAIGHGRTVRVNALIVASGSQVRLTLVDSGPIRTISAFRDVADHFDEIFVARAGGTRNVTKLLLDVSELEPVS